jgi:hypothetical protein
MKTIEELKNELVVRIEELDKSQMGLHDLICYADLLKKADDLFQPSYSEMMAAIMSNAGCACKRGDNDG